MLNIWVACFNSVDTGLCMLRVHDTSAHDCSNMQLIGCFMSCFASDQYSVKVILSGREVHSSTPPTLQLLLQFCFMRREKTRMQTKKFLFSLDALNLCIYMLLHGFPTSQYWDYSLFFQIKPYSPNVALLFSTMAESLNWIAVVRQC